jgi:hypothetical protein
MIQRRVIVVEVISGELVRIWMEAVAVCLDVLSEILQEGLSKVTKDLNLVICNLVQILTECFQKTR